MNPNDKLREGTVNMNEYIENEYETEGRQLAKNDYKLTE